MKFCQPHWDSLREAIDTRGLSGFIATDGYRAAENLARGVDGEEETLDTFDPLMGAHWVIVGMIDELIGGTCLLIDGCPLCWVKEQHESNCTIPDCGFDPEKPIAMAADAALARYHELKESS